MGKVLIAYSKFSEKGKVPNEEKVVLELENFFVSKGLGVTKFLLESKNKMKLEDHFRREKKLEVKGPIPKITSFDIVIIGSPVTSSLKSAPIVNAFIRQLSKFSGKEVPHVGLFATGVIPGFAIKKMQSLLSMKGIKPSESAAFTSIFEFDSKKLLEAREFAQKMTETILTK